ncbi:HlyD family efflux transporter periplasmic adaptor subunit [Paraflavisolibacter sp. H34]|uniref:HlyD family secretion protein n=1 Tax=Huijunlia imazamoxiresistens TaxID=3127457 RepID=UPI0030188A9E
MEDWNNYTIRGFRFATWFFRLLLFILATSFALLFVLRINETVVVREGEIVAANPQTDYKAPFEAQLVKLYVTEGQPVAPGDTLLVLKNETLTVDQAAKKAETVNLEQKIQTLALQQAAVQRKKAALAQGGSISHQKHLQEQQRRTQESGALAEQYRLQQERVATLTENFNADAELYKKDMLSKADYNTSRNAWLAAKEALAGLHSQLQRQRAESRIAGTGFHSEQNTLAMSRIDLEESAQALQQARNELEGLLTQARQSLRKLEADLDRQYMRAARGGIVNFVYNTRQTSNLINKGDLLLSIAPRNTVYYAKAIIPEKEARYVRAGLPAHLRLDAYYRFEHGPIRGKVTYMAERKEGDKYYALIGLPPTRNLQLRSGYSFRGEIITGRLTLFRYCCKKLFKNLDS